MNICTCALTHDFRVLAGTHSTAVTNDLNNVYLSCKEPSYFRMLDLSPSSDEIKKKSGEPTKMGPLERVFHVRLLYSSLSPLHVITDKDSAKEMLWFFLAWADWRCPEFQSRLCPRAVVRNIQSWTGLVLDFMKFHVRLFEAAHTGRSALLKQKLVFGPCLETCECSELCHFILICLYRHPSLS